MTARPSGTARPLGQYSLHRKCCWFVLAGVIYLALASPGRAEQAAPVSNPGAATAAATADAQQLARGIDAYFERYWASQGVEPAQPADDAEFVRRAYLDFAGKIPPVSEVRSFLAESSSGKRGELIDRLLGQGGYSRHFANLWLAILLSGAADNAEIRAAAPRLETWLRLRFAANLGFDQIAAELLAAPATQRRPLRYFERRRARSDRILPGRRSKTGAAGGQHLARVPGPASPVRPMPRPSAHALDAAGVLVVRSPVHGIQRRRRRPVLVVDDDDSAKRREAADMLGGNNPLGLKIPDSDIFALAAFLDGGVPEGAPSESRRAALVRWLTARENRWFASAIVNRVWEQLLGRGLIDPADDLEAAGPNDHAELLTMLAAEFKSHGYDLQYLLRAIAATRLYQMSSLRDPARPSARHQFARMPLRKMTAEQLFDSLVQATGLRESRAGRGALPDVDSMRGGFRQKFADPSVARTEAETSILQALALMNGKLVIGATDLKQGETLAAVVSAPFLDTGGQVETLFLATLSRPPSAAESRQFVDYVEQQSSGRDAGAALADVFWALLNSAEFVLVH